jgi:hypothetical protein
MVFANPSSVVAARADHAKRSARACVNRTKVPLSCQHQPAVGDGTIEASLVFGRRALQLIQEWPVDLLDMDAAVLQGFDSVGQLNELARGDFRIGKRARFGELRSSKAWSQW